MQGMIEAVAEAMASIDGELEGFKREKEIGDPVKALREDPGFKGTYVGYMEDAGELLRLVEAKGFKLVPAPPVPTEAAVLLEAIRIMKRDCGSHHPWETISEEGKTRWLEQARAKLTREMGANA